MKKWIRPIVIGLLGAVALAARPAAAAGASTEFLEFPMAVKVTGARHADAFAWLVKKGERTMVMFAAAPDFAPRKLYEKSDADGQPIVDVALSPDARFVVFDTGDPYGGEHAHNPASLVTAPQPAVWLIETKPHASPRQVGPGLGGLFAPDGDRFLYAHGGDLHLYDPGARTHDTVAVKGGARFGDVVWLNDSSGVVFSDDRGGYTFLGRYRFGADRLEWLVTGADRLAAPALSPDGTKLAWLRFPGREHGRAYDQTESEPFAVEVLDLKTGAARELWKSDRRAAQFYADPREALRWIGDDALVFHSESDGWDRLYAVPAAGGSATPLTPTGCEAAESARGLSNELAVLHNCRNLDTRQMSVIDAADGHETDVPLSDIVAADAAASGGRYFAFAGGDARNPVPVRVLDLQTRQIVFAGKPQDYGWHGSFSTPDPVPVTFKAEDGVTVHGQLFLPNGQGPHPGLIYVHGGPPRQMFPAFHFMSYYADDYAMNRRLAENGYAVLSVNYRSGVGYGQAFREDPGRAWRAASEYQDVLAGGRFLAARPETDPKRIGIWGGSYGGLLTGQALARNSDLFKAGVAIHGVFDWSWSSTRPFLLNAGPFFGVDPDQDKARALKASPLGAIEGWRSPVLLFHGDGDLSVDVFETVDLTQRLRAQGVAVKTVIVPDEAHDFVRHSTWLKLWSEMSAFFDEHLGGTPSSVAQHPAPQ